MKLETEWYSVTLPPDYAGEMKAGVLRIRCAFSASILELECIRKSGGTTKDLDLKDHAGADCQRCTIGALRGYRSESATLARWALSGANSNKMLLVRFKKADEKQVGSLVEPVIKNIQFK